MEQLNKLYDLADSNNIAVHDYRMGDIGLSAASIKFSNKLGIFLDYKQISTVAEEKVLLSHELGHCETGAMHNVSSTWETKTRNEYRADKWAVHQLIPFHSLQNAFICGYTEVWQLAEYFNVTEDFIRTTYRIYQNEGLLSPSV